MKNVFRYLKTFGEFNNLPNDRYIHWYMIPHLLQSGDTETPVQLLKDFKWIQHCLVYTSPVRVITHFKLLFDASNLGSENHVCMIYLFSCRSRLKTWVSNFLRCYARC